MMNPLAMYSKSKLREERIGIKGRTVIYAGKVCKKGKGGRNG